MKILLGKRNAFIDVFVGEGWENWSRVKLDKDILHHQKGRHLSQQEAKEVFKHVRDLSQP